MLRFRKGVIALVALLVLFEGSVATSAAGGKVENVGAFSDSSASDSIKAALEQTGYKVTSGSGAEICQIWFRKALPDNQPTNDQGAIFTQIGVSTLVGVIQFPAKTTDYRGQPIKAGVYTLRYAMNPADGNHMGIAQTRDFLLMSPIETDKDASAQFAFKDLVKMSAQSAGTQHPCGLNMGSAEGQSAFPAEIEDDSGHVILAAKVKTASGKDIAFQLTVKGIADQ